MTYDRNLLPNIHCNRFGKWVLQESNKENYCSIILSTGENEKHNTLIRYDIIQGLKPLYDELGDNHIKQIAMELNCLSWRKRANIETSISLV